MKWQQSAGVNFSNIEQRISKLEQQQSAQQSKQFPPRVGILISDDYDSPDALNEAIQMEQSKQGTLGVIQIDVIESENGYPKQEVEP